MTKEQAFELELNALLKKVEQSKTPLTAEFRAKKARQFVRENIKTGTDRSIKFMGLVSESYVAAIQNIANAVK